MLIEGGEKEMRKMEAGQTHMEYTLAATALCSIHHYIEIVVFSCFLCRGRKATTCPLILLNILKILR